jgi:hypothetical protein
MSAGFMGGCTLLVVGGRDNPSRVMDSECKRATSRNPNSLSFWIWNMKPENKYGGSGERMGSNKNVPRFGMHIGLETDAGHNTKTRRE